MFRNSVCSVVQQSGLGTLSQNEYLHRETGQFFEGQGHYDSQMKHCFPCYSSKSVFKLRTSYSNDTREKKPHNDFWVKRSKVNLPVTFCLHFISNRISLRLLITVTSNFVKIWRMMIGRHSEHQIMKKGYWSRSVTHVFWKCFVYMPFWWIEIALVLRMCGL